MSFLKLKEVSIGYHHKNQWRVVQDKLTLSANPGELIALIGTNGCGKTTLLRSIAFLQPLIAGEISIDAKNIASLSNKERARYISVVLTDQTSIAAFTVSELISIGRDPYTGWLGSLTKKDHDIIQRAIEMTNLEGYEHRNIHELSDGERQRVFIARALVQDTPIILLDEPTAHLDLPNRINTMMLLQKLARETNKTIFISTHELETALQVADKIWLMEKLKGVKVGVPEDMVLKGLFDDAFSHEAYVFDKEFGTFVVNRKLDKAISTHVANSRGVLARWTTKALSRKGFQITEHAPLSLSIDEKNNIWTIRFKDNIIHKNSIEEMLDALSALNDFSL